MGRDGVRIFNDDGEEVGVFYSISRKGDKLVMDGKAMGTLDMDMILTVEQFLKSIKMMFCWAVISFIILLPYFILKRIVLGSRYKET